ncbi:hypothetical protein PORY_000170 [Pneumocystis oryctolagi]|uniref:Uncharacterized protein n=1 Tax=Pneumocystis oryctolagi TaxID=42067 RepID=A0ACB7CEH1_9ASCO|nr:hypothetical protein PORY_000170 [Pneumocystis oryctolagi]
MDGHTYLTQFNIIESPMSEDRTMTTGRHIVRDISCKQCGSVVGWKYDKAFESSQMYKEGNSGSGCVSVFLQTAIFGPSKSFHLCTDISLQACKATLKTYVVNSDPLLPSYLDVIHTNLTQGLYLINNVDLLVFNPPYVPTEPEEMNMSKNMENIWAGGTEGVEIIYKVLNSVNEILSNDGLFYLVAISENKPEKIADFMKTHWNMKSQIILKRCAGRETLYVIRFNKANTKFVLES